MKYAFINRLIIGYNQITLKDNFMKHAYMNMQIDQSFYVDGQIDIFKDIYCRQTYGLWAYRKIN